MNTKACKVVTKRILPVFREIRGKNFGCGEAPLSVAKLDCGEETSVVLITLWHHLCGGQGI